MDRKIIKDLIEASYVKAPHEREWTTEVEVFNKLKFAELIIRECAKIAGEAEANEREGRSVHYVILEHFGVE